MSRAIAPAVLTNWETAIANTKGIKASVRAEVFSSRIFFTAPVVNNPYAGAEAAGIIDAPTPQCAAYNTDNDEVVTFYNDSGVLKYMTQGNSTPVNTALTITGNPSVYGNYIFHLNGTTLWRRTITWSLVTSRNTDPFSSDSNNVVSGTPLVVHAVDDMDCVMILDDDGGLRAVYASSIGGLPTYFTQSARFMFPKAIDYTGGGSERTMLGLATFSGALKIGSDVFVYITNNYKGSVVSAAYSEDTQIWGDIFEAVPTDLRNSLCEFRVSNAYERNGTAYLVGQYHRTENIETDRVYTMILSSPTGRAFSIDRFALVSDAGYRFHAVCGTDKLFLTHCNRVCYANITHVFDGVNGTAAETISIPVASIKSFQDSNLRSGTIELKAGDEALTFDPLIKDENLIKVYFGYSTSLGIEDVVYGTYVISRVVRGFSDGKRALTLNLINETEWQLTGLSSPFYTEIFSKSSTYADLTEASGELYAAPNVRLVSTELIVDFWSSEPHDDTGITGISLLSSGGVNYYETTGSHTVAFRTKDLKSSIGLPAYPLITATSVTGLLFGWSHAADTSGSVNDTVELVLVTRDPDTGDETFHYSSESERWPNTWDTSVGGNDPVNVSVTGLTVGHEITKVGMKLNGSVSTWFCPSRVHLTAGVRIYEGVDDGNTPWKPETGIGIRLPGKGRPYIMFSQKPFDSFNFKIEAEFSDTATVPNVNYPVAAGLVGLGENAMNYIVGRYNKAQDQLEIIKVRDGVETLLESGASPYTMGSSYKLLFEHTDGTFRLYARDATDEDWLLGISYDWTVSDGWMYTSETTTKKCGIYGIRDAPKFRIPGFYMSSDPDLITAEAIPFLPGYDADDFASSGFAEIGACVYSYSSKIGAPSPLRGPYQFRQNDLYTAPYGDGYGLEMRYFNWLLSDLAYQGDIVAVDNGFSFEITHSEFQVFVKNDGVTEYLRNRSRHYSENTSIARTQYGTSNRVYITGGLRSPSLVDGKTTKHLYKDWCLERSTGEIYCTFFAGANDDEDATVADLIENITTFAGGRAIFPGDATIASQAISGDAAVGTMQYAEGFDLRFQVASYSSVSVKVNIIPEGSGESQVQIKIEDLGSNNYRVSMTLLPSSTLVESFSWTMPAYESIFRVLFHDNFATVYVSDRWIYTFSVAEFDYPNNLEVYLSGTFTATNIRFLELCDWREAVYIDLETDGNSAIGNVIQERPIEIVHQPDGSIAYWYDPSRELVNMLYEPRDHRWYESPPRDGASDAIIYTASEVKCLQMQEFAEDYGFSTRVYRFPNLDVGAFRAARVMLIRLYEQSKPNELICRPDARLIPGDIYQVAYNVSGTGTAVSKDIIVEDLSLNVSAGSYSMSIKGREASSLPDG